MLHEALVLPPTNDASELVSPLDDEAVEDDELKPPHTFVQRPCRVANTAFILISYYQTYMGRRGNNSWIQSF